MGRVGGAWFIYAAFSDLVLISTGVRKWEMDYIYYTFVLNKDKFLERIFVNQCNEGWKYPSRRICMINNNFDWLWVRMLLFCQEAIRTPNSLVFELLSRNWLHCGQLRIIKYKWMFSTLISLDNFQYWD